MHMQLLNSVEHTDWCSKQLENPTGINPSSSALSSYSLIPDFVLNESILIFHNFYAVQSTVLK